MTRVELATLAYRLLAVFFFLQAMMQAPTLFLWLTFGTHDGAEMYLLSVVAGSGTLVVLSVAAFLASGGLARRTFRDEGVALPGWSSEAVLRTGLALLGVWSIVKALPLAVRLGIYFFDGQPDYAIQSVGSELTYALVQVVVGVLLFMQARGISQLWKATQEFGLKPELNEPVPPKDS
jgi:hypothetical protein